MPIKYQCLGGGGSTELTVKTSKPNTTVTITKENFEKVLVSDDSCSVVCKLVDGTYQIKAEAPEGEISQKEIVISNQEQADLRITDQIKNLPLGSKLKFSSGKEFILQAKNLGPNHEANTVTLVSEFIIESTSVSTYNHSATEMYRTLSPKYYNELSLIEKNKIIMTKYVSVNYTWYSSTSHDWEKSTTNCSQYFYCMSPAELGFQSNSSVGVPFGFTSDTSRIKKYKNGSAGEYFTRDTNRIDSTDDPIVNFVKEDGTNATSRISYTAGFVPACDIKDDAKVALDSDGYWVITE